MRILVVDDSLETLDSLERLLTAEGYHVDATPRVSEALDLLDELPYDLVLTDLRFPGRGGLEVVRHVGDNIEATKVITITGYPDPETKQKAIDAGATAYLTKPVVAGEITDAVRRACARGAGQRFANADVAAAFARSRRLQRLQQYARTHIDERITAEAAASVVGLETTYFSEWFVDRTRVRFSDWVTEWRIQAAETLFLTGNPTILETALAVGFGTVRTFQRACHRHRGMTPSDLRAWVRQHGHTVPAATRFPEDLS